MGGGNRAMRRTGGAIKMSDLPRVHLLYIHSHTTGRVCENGRDKTVGSELIPAVLAESSRMRTTDRIRRGQKTRTPTIRNRRVGHNVNNVNNNWICVKPHICFQL